MVDGWLLILLNESFNLQLQEGVKSPTTFGQVLSSFFGPKHFGCEKKGQKTSPWNLELQGSCCLPPSHAPIVLSFFAFCASFVEKKTERPHGFVHVDKRIPRNPPAMQTWRLATVTRQPGSQSFHQTCPRWPQLRLEAPSLDLIQRVFGTSKGLERLSLGPGIRCASAPGPGAPNKAKAAGIKKTLELSMVTFKSGDFHGDRCFAVLTRTTRLFRCVPWRASPQCLELQQFGPWMAMVVCSCWLGIQFDRVHNFGW